MRKPFIYGVSVEGDYFTDRVKETARLKLDFENGLNTILISPRRMGKTSLVNRVKSSITDKDIMVIKADTIMSKGYAPCAVGLPTNLPTLCRHLTSSMLDVPPHTAEKGLPLLTEGQAFVCFD